MLKTHIKNFWPFIKYCIVGTTGTAIDLIALYIFVEYFSIPIIPAAALSFLLAVTNNFIFNKIWTFKNHSKNYRKLYIKFLLVSTVGLALTVSFMHLFANIFGIWYIFAKILTSLIVLTWNFLGNKFWTFKLEIALTHIPKKLPFDLSIVIPAYNEGNRIKATLLIINDYIKSNNLNAEIIVVSDGSTDNTCEVVKEFTNRISNLRLESYPKNQGKGFAVKTGIEAGTGKQILITDADNSTPIEELKKLQAALRSENAQIAIGSRYLPKSNVKIKQPAYRIAISRFGNLLIRIFLIDNIKDTQCGFKLFTNQAAKQIFSLQKVRRFAFDMEALVIATNLGLKIVEVPVSWFNSTESRIRPIKDSLITLKDLVYIKLNLWSGRYRK
jgi:dolichyl-phosphate beta-glucosyltransferase